MLKPIETCLRTRYTFAAKKIAEDMQLSIKDALMQMGKYRFCLNLVILTETR